MLERLLMRVLGLSPCAMLEKVLSSMTKLDKQLTWVEELAQKEISKDNVLIREMENEIGDIKADIEDHQQTILRVSKSREFLANLIN